MVRINGINIWVEFDDSFKTIDNYKKYNIWINILLLVFSTLIINKHRWLNIFLPLNYLNFFILYTNNHPHFTNLSLTIISLYSIYFPIHFNVLSKSIYYSHHSNHSNLYITTINFLNIFHFIYIIYSFPI